MQILLNIVVMKLTKCQRKAISASVQEKHFPIFIWNHKMKPLFRLFDQSHTELDDEGQTYLQFVEMQNREPNQEGTGRFKFTKIKFIEYIFIPKSITAIPQKATLRINNLIGRYLRIPVSHQKKLKMTVKGAEIIDKIQNLAYTIKVQQKALDVYDILDVLMEYRQDESILVAFIEANLQEEGDILDGRACGDGVAVVSYEKKDLEQDGEAFFQTALHEILHTLGFDHCVAWTCLMNAYTSFTSWLCPACLRKLYHELELESQASISEWIGDVVTIFQQVHYNSAAKMGRQILKSFKIE